MFSESEGIFERQKRFRLMQDHPEWSLRSYARAVGHDLRWVRKWRQRFSAWARPTLEMFVSQSRRPKTSPKRLSEQLKDQICALRESLSERFHRAAGAGPIQYFFKLLQSAVPCASSIYKVLHERAYLQPRRPVVPVPLTLPAPLEEWEMDFGEIYLGEVEGSLEFFLVVDRGTSRVIYLEGSTGYRAESALDAVMRLFNQCGLPRRLRFDRDPRLWGSWSRDSYPSPLVRLLYALGLEVVSCPPHRPDKKPIVERCIGTLKHEWLARHSPTTLADALGLLEPLWCTTTHSVPIKVKPARTTFPMRRSPTGLPGLRCRSGSRPIAGWIANRAESIAVRSTPTGRSRSISTCTMSAKPWRARLCLLIWTATSGAFGSPATVFCSRICP